MHVGHSRAGSQVPQDQQVRAREMIHCIPNHSSSTCLLHHPPSLRVGTQDETGFLGCCLSIVVGFLMAGSSGFPEALYAVEWL